ncbi:hypothetical protein G4G28_10325 [Massilia sp. Dwa41.01b]|uniref:hypothetical protein n=1 Tax=Massilia sp. Dwa41.01b TaxID=2709302 RepID=UPI0016014842|nr:hypothetical protein [Massilia sp. Dwa41.01b]QNA88793.1 hypothetical protein G4G28_10325 [Massilia sp. Dwa41.01b]
MAWIAQLLFPRRRRNRRELAARAMEVVARVLFDVGVDRFRKGSLLVDAEFRVRFVSGDVPGPVLAAVQVASLAQARALPLELDRSPLGAALLKRRVALVVQEWLGCVLAQSAELRALPARRQPVLLRKAAASK